MMYYIVLLSYNAFAFVTTVSTYWFFSGLLGYNQLALLLATGLLYIVILPVLMAITSRLYRHELFEEKILSLLVMLVSALLLFETYQLGKHGYFLHSPVYVSILILLLICMFIYLRQGREMPRRKSITTIIVSVIILSSLLVLDAWWFYEHVFKIMLVSLLALGILYSIITLPSKALHSAIEPLALVVALVLQVLLLEKFFITSMLFVLFSLLSLAWRNLFTSTGCPFTRMPLLIRIGVMLVPLASISEFIKIRDMALIISLISIYLLITGNTVPKQRYTSDGVDAL